MDFYSGLVSWKDLVNTQRGAGASDRCLGSSRAGTAARISVLQGSQLNQNSALLPHDIKQVIKTGTRTGIAWTVTPRDKVTRSSVLGTRAQVQRGAGASFNRSRLLQEGGRMDRQKHHHTAGDLQLSTPCSHVLNDPANVSVMTAEIAIKRVAEMVFLPCKISKSYSV